MSKKKKEKFMMELKNRRWPMTNVLKKKFLKQLVCFISGMGMGKSYSIFINHFKDHVYTEILSSKNSCIKFRKTVIKKNLGWTRSGPPCTRSGPLGPDLVHPGPKLVQPKIL